MRLAGQRTQRGGHFAEAGTDVGRRGAGLAADVGVAGVRTGYGVPEVPLTGRERITNHAEYLSRSGEPLRLLPGW